MKSKPKLNEWTYLIILVLILGIVAYITAGFFGMSNGPIGSGNVAVIPVKGIIVSEGTDSLFSESVASSADIVRWIKIADETQNIDAIVFEINSPGGTPVASDEIVQAIKKVNKTTVALIKDVGASGAYWIASATDHIIANRMSITGSIGVVGSYLGFAGFLDNYNVTYERLIAGKYKDMGTPFKEMTNEERELYQLQLDVIHKIFMDDVAANRGLDSIEELATGQIYLGVQAIDNGLVDELGGVDEVKVYLENQLDTSVNFIKYEKRKGFFSSFGNVFSEQSFLVGRGIGDRLIEEGEGVDRVRIWT